MKKLFTLVAVVTIGFAANAQYTSKNALKVNPISAIVKTGNISYERAIAKNQSFQLGAFYSAIGLDDLQYRGFGITPEYRLYLGGNAVAMNGGYVAPYARYQQFTIGEKSSDAKAKFETLGGGFVLGYEKASASGFVIDVFVGPSFSNIKFKAGNESDYELKNNFKGFGIRSGISVGFTF